MDTNPLRRFLPYVTGAVLFAFAGSRGDWPVALGIAVGAALVPLMRMDLRRRRDDEQALLAGARAQEKRSQEHAARLSDEVATLSAVLNGMAEGVWITDAQGTIVRHNVALKEMLFAGQALEGQRPIAVVRKAELHEAVLRACAEGASTQLELSLEGLRPRILAVRVTPLGEGRPGSAAVFHDVTELRRLETIRKEFVANVSHELRTPLTAIRGYAETLAEGVDDPAYAKRMVGIILRQSERLSALVEDLLELSRLESNELKLASEPVPVAEALKRACDAVRPRAEAKRIQLSCTLPEGLTVQGDERGLEHVLVNLLDNAVKYTPEGGRVEVLGRPEGGQCVIAVRDSGVGIEAKHLPRLFERFYRVDKGRSRDMGGTGLGLSIVKHVVQGMRGEVRVESEPGRGSTFTVVLPAARENGQPG